MLSSMSGGWLRRFSIVACALAVLLTATAALAYGRVEWPPRNVKPRSDGNSWNVEIKVYLPCASTMCLVIASPRPVPCVNPAVLATRKNFWNICRWFSFEMP